MRRADWLRLLLLAAIWGASFLFMRLAAPSFGPLLTGELRALIAGGALMLWLLLLGNRPDWRAHGRVFFTIGLLNSAIPFTLYGYAALHLPASLSVILNATSPLFGALFSAAFLAEPLTRRALLGLALGFAGVALISGFDEIAHGPGFWWACAACLGASACYGLNGVVVRRSARGVPAPHIAAASQIAAAVLLLPLALGARPLATPGPLAWGALLALALLCSAIAYLLYYRLMQDVGPTRALTVTFLMPAFGMLWGALFLAETISLTMLAGAALIVAGTVLISRAPAQASLSPPSAGSTTPVR
ncbi:MAG TPA: DMT family transporter [Nevskiaceae bacterium]|nr:DMT family transporter [Nevskiaceae bacterium]